MLLIIEINKKQYIIEKNNYKIYIDKIKIKKNKFFKINKILFYKNNNKILVGNPYIDNFYIIIKVINHIKGKKIHILKFKRRNNYKKKIGYRSMFSKIHIKKILKNK